MAIELDNVDILTEVFYSALPQSIEVDYFLEADDLLVYAVPSSGAPTLLTNETHYTVFDAGVESGGSLTVTALPSGVTPAKFLVVNKPDFKQPNQFASNTAFPADAHESQQDRITLISKYLQNRVQRAIRTPEYESSSMELPAAADRAGKTLSFLSSGGVAMSDLPSSSVDEAVTFATKSALKIATGYSAGALARVLGEAEVFQLTAGAPSEAAGDYQGVELTYAGDANKHWRRLTDGNYVLNSWFGALGGSSDNATANRVGTQAALDYAAANSIPEVRNNVGDLIIDLALKGRNEVTFDMAGWTLQCIADADDQATYGVGATGCYNMGSYHPFDSNDHTFHECNATTKGDDRVTLSDSADASNYAVGDIVLIIEASGTFGDGTAYLADHYQWNEITAISTADLVLKYPVANTADAAAGVIGTNPTGVWVANVDYSDTSGKDTGVWTPRHVCKRCGLINAKIKNAYGPWLNRNAMFEPRLENIHVVDSAYGLVINAVSHAVIRNITGVFYCRAVEVKSGAHDIEIHSLNLKKDVNVTDTAAGEEEVFSIGENSRDIVVHDCVIDGAGHTVGNFITQSGATRVRVQDCQFYGYGTRTTSPDSGLGQLIGLPGPGSNNSLGSNYCTFRRCFFDCGNPGKFVQFSGFNNDVIECEFLGTPQSVTGDGDPILVDVAATANGGNVRGNVFRVEGAIYESEGSKNITFENNEGIIDFYGVLNQGSLTAFADAGGGEVLATTDAAHYLETGDEVIHASTTNYNGTFTVTKVSSTTYKFTDTWVSDDATGDWEQTDTSYTNRRFLNKNEQTRALAIVKQSTNANVNHTGTTAATSVWSLVIPAGALDTNDRITISASGNITGSAGTKSIKLRATNNGVTTSCLIGTTGTSDARWNLNFDFICEAPGSLARTSGSIATNLGEIDDRKAIIVSADFETHATTLFLEFTLANTADAIGLYGVRSDIDRIGYII